MRTILVLLSIFLLTGCAASGQNFSTLEAVSNTEGKVYIYRPNKFFQGGTWPTVFINGEKRFELKNQGYIVFNLPPGQHNLKIGKSHLFANWGFDDVEGVLTIKPKERYFLKLDIEFQDMQTYGNVMSFSGSIALISMPENKAIAELKPLKSSM